MVITLTGENSFGLRAELNKLTGEFVVEHGDMALERLDGEEAPYERLQEAVQSPPFLSSKKLVILQQPGKNKTFADQVEQLFGGLPEMTDVVVVESKLDKRLGYYKFLKTKTDFREFPEMDQAAMARWLTAQAKAAGGSLGSADAAYLIGRAGLDQRALANELDKLLLYDPHITRQTIDLLIDATPQSTIFQLLEAAFAGNTRRTFALYSEQRQLKVEPAQIIAMLAWQLHVMAVLKTAGERTPEQIAREAKLNPYVVRKTLGIVRRLSLATLRQLIADLLVIDMRLKRQPIDADEVLQNYLLQITG
jgi:DNA polymerase III subunit delta